MTASGVATANPLWSRYVIFIMTVVGLVTYIYITPEVVDCLCVQYVNGRLPCGLALGCGARCTAKVGEAGRMGRMGPMGLMGGVWPAGG